jgi:CRP/FNR family transcriptional regulator, anaerobic regulatory protein
MVFGKSCANCGVRNSALCGVLTDSALAPLAATGQQRKLERGETLIRAGDRARLCANIQRGLMKICHTNPAGQEVILGLLWPGDFVGSPFLDADVAAHDVVAISPVSLCIFPQAAVERTMADHPLMERQLLSRTLAELGQVRTALSRLARATALARVAGFIAETAQRSDSDAPDAVRQIDLPLSRGEMADLLGLTIETVSRQMTRLKTAGVIGLPGGRAVVIQDPDALAEAAEELT